MTETSRPVRLVARSTPAPALRATVDVACDLELELASGARVPLLTDRGWSSSATWDQLTVEEVAETALTVTGPDEPGPGVTGDEEEAAHWAHLAARARAAGVPVGADALRALPLEAEASPELAAHLRRARRDGAALTALLGLHPALLGTRPPEDALGADAASALRRELADDVGADPAVWSRPGVVLLPGPEAGEPGGVRAVLLHTTAVVAGPAARLEGLRGATVADLVGAGAAGAAPDTTSERWILAADLNALSFDPDPGPARAARQDGLLRALRTRAVVVERVPAGDRAALREASSLGLRRVGREIALAAP